jgi:hypothetical protein
MRNGYIIWQLGAAFVLGITQHTGNELVMFAFLSESAMNVSNIHTGEFTDMDKYCYELQMVKIFKNQSFSRHSTYN